MNNKTILLIEDDFDTQFLFTECLRSENFDVVSFDHGNAALEYLNQNNPPNLVVMDLNFPHSSPEEFVTQMRSIPAHQNVPIVVVSGKSDINEYAERLQASGYLKKPYDIDPLISLINRALI